MIFSALVSCGTTPEQRMQTHVEQTVELEEGFQEQQEPLLAAEEAERERFEEMMERGLNERDENEALVSEAIQYVEERKKRMEAERKSLKAAYEEFQKGAAYVHEIEDEDVEEQAMILVEVMEKRYEVHSALYEAYIQAASLDRELYEMFLEEEVDFGDLEEQINLIKQQV
nr:YkyA family protein [Geomicrobium halophilum]